ncbi:MAG: hypothetical protein NDJ94_10360 [Vicinamibacteria bacterium]|nr:hypothetical protein [Vicinamibacteria bacterium]
MRRMLGTLMLMPLLVAGSAHAGDKVDFKYTLGTETTSEPDLIPGFDLSGESLKVELRRPSHLYLITEAKDGSFRLVWPDVRAARDAGASLPRTTLLRLDQGGANGRTWIVVSATGVPELDTLISERRSAVPASIARGLRERYPVVGLLERDVQEHGASVKLATRGGKPAVVIEEVVR